jgi:hypothetical protein
VNLLTVVETARIGTPDRDRIALPINRDPFRPALSPT